MQIKVSASYMRQDLKKNNNNKGQKGQNLYVPSILPHGLINHSTVNSM